MNTLLHREASFSILRSSLILPSHSTSNERFAEHQAKLVDLEKNGGSGQVGGSLTGKLAKMVYESHPDATENAHFDTSGYISYGPDGTCKAKCDFGHYLHDSICMAEDTFCETSAPANTEFDPNGKHAANVQYTHEVTRTKICSFSCKAGYVWNGESTSEGQHSLYTHNNRSSIFPPFPLSLFT